MPRTVIFIAAICLAGIFLFVEGPEVNATRPQKTETMQPLTLLLLRHAKSDHSDTRLADFDRPLAESGRKEAEEIGAFLEASATTVDLVIASPSKRTRQTAEIICKKAGYDFAKIRWDSTLYDSSTENYLAKIRATDDQYRRVLFIGHNPSTTNVANSLQSDTAIAEVKTCGLVAISFGNAKWKEAEKKNGKLLFYRKPE